MSENKRFIAICDILGFKNLMYTTPLNKIISDFLYLQHRTKQDTQIPIFHVDKNLGFKVINEQVGYVYFSDTILLWTETQIHMDVMNFFDVVGRILSLSISLELPLRIGIAYGDTYINPSTNTYLGIPIINAYLTEQNQEWVGGACHISCLEYSHFNEILKIEPKLLVDYKIPVKSSFTLKSLLYFKYLKLKKNNFISNYAVAWHTFDSALLDDTLLKLQNKSSKRSVIIKYKNALIFYKHFVKQHNSG